MPQSIYIGNFSKGLTTNPLPFNIDNDAFPNMYNFYAWRKRVRKKRGTLFLGRATKQIKRVLDSAPPLVYQSGQITLSSGAGNLFVATITGVSNATKAVITTNGHPFQVGDAVTISGVTGTTGVNGQRIVVFVDANKFTVNYDSSGDPAYVSGGTAIYTNEFPTVQPGTISVTVGANTYTEPNPPNGTLVGSPAGSGTINYATGAITISGGASSALIGTYAIYPNIPALGTQDINITAATANYAALLAFDQIYSYQCNQAPNNAQFFNVTYYKQSNVPFGWSGADYQQFYTTNYLGALWATNSKPGFHFVNGAYAAVGSGTTTVTFTFTRSGIPYTTLVDGDVLWFNEWNTGGSTINGVTGVVTDNTGFATGVYVVTFSANVTVAGTGIAQLLTNSIIGQDGIRWYDGDPTGGTGIPTVTGKGWVNFSPPLTASTVSINNLPAALYYVIGALMIVPFKDRLVLFNVTIGTSSGATFNLQDTVIWSQNGTPYYTVDASGNSTLVPDNQTAQANSWYVDQTGLGGYRSAGIQNPILTTGFNEDAIIVGFGGNGRKTRFVYTGNDFDPFLFFNINSELPSSSTFSAVNLDAGVIDIGAYGIAMTDQQSSRRIDLPIPNAIFAIQNANNGIFRANGIRDYFREWIYFAYPLDTSRYTFPTQTLMYNYRDDTWAYFYENFTTQGYYRPSTKRTWATLPYNTWASWREPWNSGSGAVLFPNVIAGNPQGFWLIKSQGTQESQCCGIQNIQDSGGGFSQITTINHCVNSSNPNTGDGDYLLFQNVIGLLSSTITGITLSNSTIGPVTIITTTNTFNINSFVTLTGIDGTTELNGNTYQIIGQTGSEIILNVDSTDFTPWVSGGTVTSAFNGIVGKVITVIDNNNFVVDIPFPQFNSIYLGLGTFAKLCLPLLQTKQFSFYWDQGRKVRLSVQKYLFDATYSSQITLQIYLSQDPNLDYSSNYEFPKPNAILSSEILYTCPLNSNIGLTTPNYNLQQSTSEGSFQIWQRANTSLIGDSFQLGFTLSDAQMRNVVYAQDEITLHGMVLTVDKGPMLA